MESALWRQQVLGAGVAINSGGTTAQTPREPITGFVLSSRGEAIAPWAPSPVEKPKVVLLKSTEGHRWSSLHERIHHLLGRSSNIEILPHLGGFSAELTATESRQLWASGEVEAIGEATAIVTGQTLGHRAHRKQKKKRKKKKKSAALNSSEIIMASGQESAQAANDTISNNEILPWGTKLVLHGIDPAVLAERVRSKYVFVMDTGISNQTGDLNVRMDLGYNFIAPGGSPEDDNGHGTHLAGTIGALANSFGIVGVAPGVNLIPYKVLDARGSGMLKTVVSAIDRMLETISSQQLNPQDVIVNLSLGSRIEDILLRAAIARATALGVRFAIAAGNTRGDVDGSIGGAEAYIPASAREERQGVYVTSALNSNLQMSSFSNYDQITDPGDIDNIAFAAPGENILSWTRTPTGGFALASASGTSMAAAHVAGLLALGEISAGPLAAANGSIVPDPLAQLLAPSI